MYAVLKSLCLQLLKFELSEFLKSNAAKGIPRYVLSIEIKKNVSGAVRGASAGKPMPQNQSPEKPKKPGTKISSKILKSNTRQSLFKCGKPRRQELSEYGLGCSNSL